MTLATTLIFISGRAIAISSLETDIATECEAKANTTKVQPWNKICRACSIREGVRNKKHELNYQISRGKMEEVRNWLRGLGLEQYAPRFEEEGWDTLEILVHMSPSDIATCINKPGHRKKFEVGMRANPPYSKKTKVLQDDDGDPGINQETRNYPKRSMEREENISTDIKLDAEKITKRRSEEVETEPDFKVGETAGECDDVVSQKVETGSLNIELSDKISGSLPLGENGVTLESKTKQYPIDLDAQYDVLNAAENDTCTCNSDAVITGIESHDKTINGDKDCDIRTLEKDNKDIADPVLVYDDIINTVCVKEARNKVLRTPLQTDSSELIKCLEASLQGRMDQRSASQGFLAVKNRAERPHLEVEELVNEESGESDSEDSCAVANVEDIRDQQDLMIRNPGNRVFTKATIVKDSKNVTIAHKAEVHHHHETENKKERDNFKDQISNVVESYKRKDHLFVETNAFREVEDIINDRHWALITGKPGDGKSSMAAHLLLKYQNKGFDPVIVTNAQDWKAMVKGKTDEKNTEKQFVMIDDMFGSMSVDERKVNEWVSMIEIMQRVVNERKGNLVVICTSRAHVFNDVKSKLKKFTCFQCTSFVDLTEEKHCLSTEEKQQIWTTYSEEYDVTSEPPFCVYTHVISPHGFPHCVELFCSNHFLREQGTVFFENPMEYVCREIQNFKENDKIKYCLLLLILFNKNKLAESQLQQICMSDPSREVINIFKAAGLSSDHAQSELKKALNSLKNTYISEDLDDTYRFSHESIRENVALIFIKDNPLHAIDEIELEFLVEHTRFHGYVSIKGSTMEPSVFVLPSFCSGALVERVTREILNGNIFTACQHQAWSDEIFLDKWLTYVLLLSSPKVKYIFTAREIFYTTINHLFRSAIEEINLNFMETLMLFNEEKALMKIIENHDMVEFWNTCELRETLSNALICACFLFPSEKFIHRLIETGAEVNALMPAKEVMRYAEHLGSHQLENNIQESFDVYSPVLCSIFTNNKTVLNVLLRNGGQMFIGDMPVALIAAAELNLPEILLELLQTKYVPDIHAVDKANRTPQTVRSDDNYRECLSLSNCNFTRFVPLLKTECTLSLIHVTPEIDCLKVLLEKGARLNEDVLVSGYRMPHFMFRLAISIKPRVLQYLLNAGLEITGMWNGKSCLNYFLWYLNRFESDLSMTVLPWFHSTSEQIDFCITFLSKYSENRSLNAVDKDGQSALHALFRDEVYVTMGKRIRHAVFQKMLSLGGNLNSQDKKGVSPVMMALSKCYDPISVMSCIEKRKPKMVDIFGRGYLHYLAGSVIWHNILPVFVKMLNENGEDINLADINGDVPLSECRSALSFKCFIDAGARLDVVNSFGQHVLFRLLKGALYETALYVLKLILRQEERNTLDNYEMVRNQLEKLDLNSKDTSGRTLMHFLMMCPANNLSGFKDVLDTMLCAGCSLATPDKDGITPLMIAAENAIIVVDIFEYCLKQESDIYGTDVQNRSVLHHCIGSSRDTQTKLNMIQVLRKRSEDIFHKGFDILAYAVDETNCDIDIILELVRYRNDKQAEVIDLVARLEKSGRSPFGMVECIMLLEQEKQVKLNIRDLLTKPEISAELKMKVASKMLLKDMAKVNEFVLRRDDIPQVLSGLNDDTTVVMLQHIEKHPSLRNIFSDLQIFKTLCKHCRIKSLDYLIKRGVPMYQQDNEGNTLLHIAIDYINNDDHLLEILTSLIERNADVCQLNRNRMTSLHVACRQRSLKPQSIYKLTANMHSVNQSDNKGMTALQYLCSNKSGQKFDPSVGFDVCLYLALCILSKDADVDHTNMKGETAAMIAIRHRAWHESLIELLIQNSKNISKLDASGNTVLHKLARATIMDESKAYLFKLMLEKGGDVTKTNQDNQTCISIMENQVHHKQIGFHLFGEIISLGDIGSELDAFCILFKHIATLKDESQESLRKMKDIIKKRTVDVNMVHCTDACTMIMVACENLLPDTISTLLSVKADPNMKDMIGCSCLTRILRSRKLQVLSVAQAIYAGDDIWKAAALHIHGFFWNNKDTAPFRNVVASFERHVTVGSRECYTIIEQLNSKALEVLLTILSNGADPDLPDVTGKTPLHHYVLSPLADIFICPAIKMLIDFGVNVNSKDCEGMTPLMACSLFPGRKSRRLNILIAAGANIREVNCFGCDVVEYGKMTFGSMRNIDIKAAIIRQMQVDN